jgi:hypothetical protein
MKLLKHLASIAIPRVLCVTALNIVTKADSFSVESISMIPGLIRIEPKAVTQSAQRTAMIAKSFYYII